mmetsp:Transcript_12811/g.26972  ORF Transcript_12811/g.26972 Transcript_12811/m.26972 type:complete len:268 (+) Transcript_12811:310-1113(+)
MYSTKSIFFFIYSGMLTTILLTSVALAERHSIASGGGAGGGANDRNGLKPADSSGSPTSGSNNNNQVTSTGGSYNSGGSSSVSNQVSGNNQSGGITGNGSHGSLATRQWPVTCPICVGTWYENVGLSTTGTSKTCGKLQESMQDVAPENQFCRQNQLLAESGGCCKTITFSNSYKNINEPCDLCNGGSVPSEKVGSLVPITIKGYVTRQECAGLANSMKVGIMSSKNCEINKPTANHFCCFAHTVLEPESEPESRLGNLRGVANDMP